MSWFYKRLSFSIKNLPLIGKNAEIEEIKIKYPRPLWYTL